MRDSYIRFFSKDYISKEQFFEFGLKETIYSPYEEAKTEWCELKRRIENNETVYIRGFGRDAKRTILFQKLYERLLGNYNVQKDSNNNAEPTKIIKKLTRYSKTECFGHELIRNYQISHIFGRTKNIYAFTAPWNIVYIPKILDPFTGHEAKGEIINEYKLLFQKQGYDKFSKFIDEFNEIITNSEFKDKLQRCLDNLSLEEDIEVLRKAVKNEFMPIEL